jgi:hypothetical protein
MIESGYRLVFVDDVDVTGLSAEQVLQVLQTKQTVKLCLKTQTAQAFHDSKVSFMTKASSSEPCAEACLPTSPTISKVASIFGKFKSASSLFSSNLATSPVHASVAADPDCIDRKKLVIFISCLCFFMPVSFFESEIADFAEGA